MPCVVCAQIERLERGLMDLRQDLNKLQAAKKQADHTVSVCLVPPLTVCGPLGLCADKHSCSGYSH